MKWSLLAMVFLVGQVATAESLLVRKLDIENDLRVLGVAHKAAVKACQELEKDIPEFNRLNDGLNETLAAKRAEKRDSDLQLQAFQASVDQLRSAYNTLLGTIWSKKVELVALRGSYVRELIRARDSARVELVAVGIEKRALERRLQDLDNFPNQAEYERALRRFYELKDRETTLIAIIVELELQIRNPVVPNESELRAEIAALERKAVEDLRVLTAKTTELGGMRLANIRLGVELAILEVRANAFKNFEIPAVCSKI